MKLPSDIILKLGMVLAATALATAQDSDITVTCLDFSLSGSMLKASCRTLLGVFQDTVLNLNDCIANDDNNLAVCTLFPKTIWIQVSILKVNCDFKCQMKYDFIPNKLNKLFGILLTCYE